MISMGTSYSRFCASMRVCSVPFDPGVRIDWPSGKVREVVQVFHFDQDCVSRIAAKTLLAGALIWMVLPVVRMMDDAGWLGVAVGTVRDLAGIVSDFAFPFLALMKVT